MSRGRGIGEETAEKGIKMSGANIPAALATAEEVRKRKLVGCGGELSEGYATSLVQLTSPQRRRRGDDNVMLEDLTGNIIAAATNYRSNDLYASCCSSSNGSSELENDTSESEDLKVEEVEEVRSTVEITTSTYELENCCGESGEFQAESGQLEYCSTAASRPLSMSSEDNSSRCCRPSTEEEKEMPTKAELEEFFSAAEKNLQQIFAQKYNFDILKDEPLEGRYEWVRVEP